VADAPDTPPAVPADAILKAQAWRSQHAKHAARLIAGKEGEKAAYPPSGSDVSRPELWRAPHWRWLEMTHG
jgi:hypothetical protein